MFVNARRTAGIRFLRMRFVGADCVSALRTGDHIGSPLRDIHVDLDSSNPRWNDAQGILLNIP